MKTMRLRISSLSLTLLLSGLFTFFYNFSWLSRIYAVVLALNPVNVGFLIAVPIALFCIFNVIFVILCQRRIEKFILIPLILISSALSYASYTYGIIFDKGMMRNIFETDQQEALSYINISSVTWILFSGILPSWLLMKATIVHPPWKKEALQKGISIVISFIVMAVIAACYFGAFATSFRNNTALRKMHIPFYAFKSVYKYTAGNIKSSSEPYTYIAQDAKHVETDRDPGKKDFIILIVGETQRSMNYSLNGYARSTNPYTEQHGVISFRNTTSCGTATAHSVPCMFSNMSRAHYKEEKALNQDNILDVLKRSGVNVYWIDNDGGCKHVCRNVETTDARKEYLNDPKYCSNGSCYDEILPLELGKIIKKAPDNDTLVVLHAMGSHGPGYYERYPLPHRKFTPNCPRGDVEHCTYQELVNEYDNTILYEDYVISEIIKQLKNLPPKWNAALMFMSDHGESLGENGIYLHGLPYMMAPPEQTHIPFISWISKNFAANKNIDLGCIRHHALTSEYSHDNLFDTLLGIFDVSTAEYRPGLDIFKSCKTKQ